MEPSEGAVAVEKPQELGFFARLLGVYLAPGETFRSIVAAPRFWAPALALTVMSVLFTGLWLSKLDVVEFIKTQNEASPRFQNQTPEQQAKATEVGAKILKPFTAVIGVIGPILFISLAAFPLLFVFRFIYGSEVTAGQAMSIASWSFLAVRIVQTPLLLMTYFLKGDWNIPPDEVFQASPALLLDKQAVSHALYTLLRGFDVFSFWIVCLMAIGFSRAGKSRFGSAIWGVLVPYLCVVGVSAAAVALFGG
jgi:hypothetical protein